MRTSFARVSTHSPLSQSRMADTDTMNPSALPEPSPPALNLPPALQAPQQLPQQPSQLPQTPSQAVQAPTPSEINPPSFALQQPPTLSTASASSFPPPSSAMPTATRAQAQAQAQAHAPAATPTQSSGPPPPGAPGRNYLNKHLAPYLRTGMTNVLNERSVPPLLQLSHIRSILTSDMTDPRPLSATSAST